MEFELTAFGRSSYVALPPLLNRFRAQRNGYKKQAYIWSLLAFLAFLLVPSCGPIKWSGDLPCSNKWALRGFHCDNFCCDVDSSLSSLQCLPCGQENLQLCIPLQGRMGYVLQRLLPQFVMFLLITVLAYSSPSFVSVPAGLLRPALLVVPLFLGYGIYLYTDCEEVAGPISTKLILLFLFLSLFLSGASLLSTALLKDPEAQVDQLGACIKQDDVLLVPINEDCLRSFVEGDDALPSSHLAVSSLRLRYCNFFCLLFMLLLIIGGSGGRPRFFFLFGLWLPVCLNFAMMWPKAQGGKLQPGTLVLFHNTKRCQRDDYSSMSVIYLGDRQVFLSGHVETRLLSKSGRSELHVYQDMHDDVFPLPADAEFVREWLEQNQAFHLKT